MAELRRRFPGTRSDRDRHGNVRWYTLDPKGRKIRMKTDLLGEPGSDRWVAFYERVRAGTHLIHDDPGTLGEMIVAYKQSTDWEELRPSTQTSRGRILEDIRENSGDMIAADVTPKDIRLGRDARKATPSAANNRIKVLSALYSWGIENDFVSDNPAKGVKRLKVNSGGFHTWTVEECLQFEEFWPLGTKARLVYSLALYLACRKIDLPELGYQHCDDEGYIRVFSVKKQAEVDQYICAPLAEAINAYAPEGLLFFTTEYGRPFTSNGLGGKFRYWCDQAGLPHCTLHGLRKACAARMAEAGCSVKEIQAVTDHDSLAEVQRYTLKARKRALSKRALEKTFGEQNVPLLMPKNAHSVPTGEEK
ncbi:MAG: tyrosine-type recombinase/integrase [Pseudomonadota bacterium]